MKTTCKGKIKGALDYIDTITCLVMSTMWFKILSAIDNTNKVIEARSATLDVEVRNLDKLKDTLMHLRERWCDIWNEVNSVAKLLEIEDHHGFVGIRRTMGEITEDTYRVNVFFVAIDKVLGTITDRFAAIYAINAAFKFLWLYPGMTIETLKDECTAFSNVYTEDVDGDELFSEICCLKQTHPHI